MSEPAAPARSPAPHLPFSRPCLSEAAALEVAEVVRSGWITSGPKVVQFEQDFAAFTGAAHALAVSSATAGLDIVMQALDLEAGDEVITPSINWVSGPNMVELNGGTTVFCEVDPRTLNLDLDHVARLIGPRTRAIMPVHYAGAPVDLDRLRALVAGRPITIVEDAAHIAGGRWRGKPIGGDSDVAVFSFHPSKNMTTAEGGMIACRDPALAARLRVLRFHGIRKDAWKNHARSGKDLYQVLEPGRKSNLTDIQATLGIHQLRDLERMNAARARLAAGYARRLADIAIVEPLALPTAAGALHAWHIYIVLLRLDRLRLDRAAVVDRLEQLGIGSALHFPPVHPQAYYREKYPGVSLPVSEDVGARLLTIPLFPGMADADLERVADAFRTIAKESGR
jgi:UDP-4-amino-4-deoxy-L-arabinose-oxoglutarate aminotransferase